MRTFFLRIQLRLVPIHHRLGWKKFLQKVLAMVKQLGLPHFLSLGCRGKKLSRREKTYINYFNITRIFVE